MTRTDAAGRLQWWILRAHWLLGIPLLAVFTATPRWLLLAASAAWAAGAWMDRTGASRKTLSRLGPSIVALFLAASVAELLLLRGDPVDSVSLLILGIQSIKFLLPKQVRDGWQLCAISLLEFLVAAAVAEELSLALFAFLFLAASAGAMWALHDMEAAELGRPAGGYRPSPGVAAWTLLLVGIAGFLWTALLFAVVPRLELRRGLQRLSRGDAVAGFSESITLREVTGIKEDRRVVARVEFPNLDRPPDPGGLYLRGAVYSRYSDGGWRISNGAVSAVQRLGRSHLLREAPRGRVSTADITLEPMEHPRLFAYGHTFLIEESFGPLLVDAEGSLFLSQPVHPKIRYRIRFVAEPPPHPARPARPGGNYLVFPKGYEDVHALGLKLAGRTGSDAVRAERLLRFFGTGFRYTLADSASSIRDFLFRKKAGHCEHFAASLALLLRAAGIPSRVAAGYLGGEWNDVGRYLIVRQSDAHAWVEAWIDGRWVTLDATPSGGDASPFFRKTGPLWLYLDWMRQRWDKYVVNYSLRMQAEAVTAGWSGIRRTGRFLGSRRILPRSWTGRPAAALALLACAAIFLLERRRRRSRIRSKGENTPRLPAPYSQLLRRLERSGFRTSPGMPMEEILEAAVRSRPDLAEDAGRFLSLYHRDRFGPSPLPPGLRSETFRRADGLRKRLS